MQYYEAIGFMKVVLAALFMIMALACQGQSIQFKEFGIKEGFTFPGGHVAYAQDSLGFLWIGTGAGLNQFDGYNFKTYKRDPKDLGSILTEGVQTMSVDPSGKLWIIYSNKMQFYDRNKDEFVTVQVLPEKSRIRSVFFDSPESLWIGSYGEGLFHHDLIKGITVRFVNAASDTSRLEDRNYIYDISYQSRFLILGTREGIWKFDRSNKTFQRPYTTESEFIASWNHRYVNRILKGKDHFWISTSVNMLKLDTSLRVLKQAPVGNMGTVEDALGNLWVPQGDDGLVCYNAIDEKLTHYRNNKNDPRSLPSNHITNAFLDRNGNVWLGSFNNGICQVVKRQVVVQRYLEGQQVTDVKLLGTGTDKELLVSTLGAGVYRSSFSGSVDSLDFRNVSDISKVEGFRDVISLHLSKSHLWCGSLNYGVLGVPIDKRSGRLSHQTSMVKFGNEQPNTISNGQVTQMYQDAFENLWIATMGFGGNLDKVQLNKTYGDVRSIKTYWGSDSTGLSRGWISGLVPEGDSSLWVGSYRGLELFHVATETFDPVVNNVEGTCLSRANDGTIFFGTKRGLYEGVKGKNAYQFKLSSILGNQFINSVDEDSNGRRWIGTESGLYCYNPKNHLLIHLNDPGIFERLTFGSSMINNGRHLVLPNHNGLTIVDVLSLKISTDPIVPIITQIQINNKVADVTTRITDVDQYVLPESANTIGHLELDHNHRNISIQFASLDLTSPLNVLYRYKLEGYEKEWRETPTTYRIANYTNLGPGTYKFLAMASNASGVWSGQHKTLVIRIHPPPWKTWWAYVGYGLLILGLLYWGRSNIVKQERLTANLQLAKVEQEKEHFELEKAKEVDRVKTSFFTSISHEFRTPLTLIQGPVQSMIEQFVKGQKDFDRNKIVDQLKLVHRNSELLLRLINQLLDLAKLESGSLKVEKSEGELNTFIGAVASSFHSFASQKNISIRVELRAEHCLALFDKDKVETILINLINNAIKFTPVGGNVSVIADFTRNPDLLSLTIQDTGIGIPEDQQNKIFERFHQVSEAHKEVGTGIGLSLVKELVHLMGGNISVKSKAGEGSEFIVILPIEVLSNIEEYTTVITKESVTRQQFLATIDGKAIIDHRQQDEQTKSKPHVLIVEDNADLRAFIIDSLGNEFYFLEAENGRIGLNIATREVPDLIISDVMMPEMDGITMATKIKKDIHTSHIPLILLTAKSSEDSKLSGLKSGADDYLTKPFNKNELLLKVRNGVSRQVKLREKLRAELMSTAPKIEVLSEDEQFLKGVKEKILERLSDEQLSVESLAEDMGMSRVQLYRKISGLTDISVNELIRKLRLQRAAQLLQQNWAPVSQVAYEVGFSNLSYFSKVFREEFGVLPSEYSLKN